MAPNSCLERDVTVVLLALYTVRWVDQGLHCSGSYFSRIASTGPLYVIYRFNALGEGIWKLPEGSNFFPLSAQMPSYCHRNHPPILWKIAEEENMEEDDNFGEKNGFFKTYHLSVLKKLDRNHLMALSACRNDAERLDCVHGLSYVHQLPDTMSSALSKPQPNGKSAVEAKQKRTRGNEAFKKKDYSGAIRLYSEAVMKAPINSDGTKPVLIDGCN